MSDKRHLEIIPETIRTVDGKPPTPLQIQSLEEYINSNIREITRETLADGEAITKLRQELGLQLRETALVIGYKPSQLLEIENGFKQFDRKELEGKIINLAESESKWPKVDTHSQHDCNGAE